MLDCGGCAICQMFDVCFELLLNCFCVLNLLLCNYFFYIEIIYGKPQIKQYTIIMV